MEIPYEVKARRDTGLWNAKIGIWLFLASEVMLFGGLFSSYIFLRLGVEPGVDNPWPTDVQLVPYGFANTLILILSSVFVVFSWLALKEGNWKKFQAWMAAVIGCAFLFLVLKGIEYNYKLTHHGMRLIDNSVVEGVVLDNTDKIRFEAKTATLDVTTGSTEFLNWIKKGEAPVFQLKREDGKLEDIGNVSAWVKKMRKKTNRAIAASRSERWTATREGREPNEDALKPITRSYTLVSDKPFQIYADDARLSAYDDKAMSFVDGSKVTGKLLGDTIKFEVHEVDLQMIPTAQQDQALVWKLINDDAVKKGWDHARDEEIKKMEVYYMEGKGVPVPDKQMRSRRVNVHGFHASGDQEEHAASKSEGADHGHAHDDHAKDSHTEHTDAKAVGHDVGAEVELGSHGAIVIEVPRKDKKFLSNHGPAYGTYYAIYFTMTGLHGLHVIGGIVVLGYFLLFGKKLFLKDPEHMANRVEVGGLFWHFVDLVWIFLFPIMYLF